MSFLLWLLLIGWEIVVVTEAKYTNQPIAPPYDDRANAELREVGVAVPHGGEILKVPGAAGWCKSNLCAPGGPESQCYSQFYVTDEEDATNNDDDPFNYPHCGASSEIHFSAYNVTFLARLYLLDLDIHGFAALTNGTDSVDCIQMFPNMCYLVMWLQNVRNGFVCDNDNATFNGEPVRPPCSSFCHDTLAGPCNSFYPAIHRRDDTVRSICSLFPNEKCYGFASQVAPSMETILLLLALSSLYILIST